MSDQEKPAEEAHGTPVIDHAPDEAVALPPEHSASIPQHGNGETPPPPGAQREADPEPVVVRRGGTPLMLTLLLCAALGGGIYYTWSHPQAVTAGGITQNSIDSVKADLAAQIQAQVQALSDRIEKLEKASPPAAPPPPAGAAAPDAEADLDKRLADVSGHVDALASREDQLAAALQKTQDLLAQRPADSAAPPPDHAAETAAGAQAQQQLADLGGKMDQALAQEKASLDALEQRLAKLEQAPPPPPPPPAAAPDTAAVTALQARVEKLEQGEGQLAGAKQDATLAVKLEAAQAALAAGTPLGDLPGAPPALARFATTAPPTEASLRATFPQISAAILAESRPEEAEKTFFARALARLEQSVTVRQGDHVIVGDPAAGIVERAQEALENGDLKGAVSALSALSGKAAAAAQGWVAQAQALLDARAALATLAAHG